MGKLPLPKILRKCWKYLIETNSLQVYVWSLEIPTKLEGNLKEIACSTSDYEFIKIHKFYFKFTYSPWAEKASFRFRSFSSQLAPSYFQSMSDDIIFFFHH